MSPRLAFFPHGLASSSLIVGQASQWETIISELRRQTHPADFWMSEQTDKLLSIAEVRQLQYFASQFPVGEYKIACLLMADQYKPETANALLKLLEEPPTYLYLILLAETDQILPTVRSRVQRLSILPASATIADDSSLAQWQRLLQGYRVSEPVARAQAHQLLYFHSLAHSGIKAETVLEPFRYYQEQV